VTTRAATRTACVIVIAAIVGVIAAVTAGPARAAQPCRSYPRPGTTVAGPAPSRLRAQYQVLRRAQRPFDRVALSRLGALPESGILLDATRYLGSVPLGGRVYLVAGRHLLPSPLEPVRCVPADERSLQQALLPSLRREYAHRALCLVILYATRAAPTCQPAPGTVAPLLIGSGVPGFGLAPDGVPAVRLLFAAGGHGPVRVAVHENFWRVRGQSLDVTPCGLDWIDGRGIVLRAVTSCVADTT
jgi:hypothetical protein